MVIRVIAVVCIFLSLCTQPQTVKSSRNDLSGITYSGGNGESFHNAIIISGAKSKSAGISAEYKYITDKYGPRGSRWLLVGQTVIREKNKIVDVVEIQLIDSAEHRIFYFDVSDFLTGRR